jgi:tRNA-splicing ligase RtcB
MPIKRVENRQSQKVPVKIWTEDVDHQSLNQLANIASLPFIHKHVAAMPDVHLGKGATVGSVIATKNAIIPAAVGVDIGCGMNAVQLSLSAKDLPDDLFKIRSEIEARIPLGAGGAHDRSGMNDRHYKGALQRMPKSVDVVIDKFGGFKMLTTAMQQMGTLGSGNHFIELCLDENDQVWVMLHSGSRGIGNKIGGYYIEKAKEYCAQHFIRLSDPDLAYFVSGTSLFDDYWEALHWTQNYALENRRLMMETVLSVLRKHLKAFNITNEGANCHHNYATIENHYGQNVYVTRKGAIRAREGDIGIIPGSMGTRSYIVRGKGNSESFCSCSHGAGRRLSRGAAKRQFTIADLEEQTKGIECRKDAGVLDEIPKAYKPIDEVMANQSDLVEILHELRQVLNIKG